MMQRNGSKVIDLSARLMAMAAAGHTAGANATKGTVLRVEFDVSPRVGEWLTWLNLLAAGGRRETRLVSNVL
jgi:hypothetical protein